jgi:hypothetical protein
MGGEEEGDHGLIEPKGKRSWSLGRDSPLTFKRRGRSGHRSFSFIGFLLDKKGRESLPLVEG